MWLDTDTAVCPGCWGTDHNVFPRDYLGTGETHICCSPECLVGWFDPDDPEFQSDEMLLLTTTTVSRDADGRIVIDHGRPVE